MKMPKGPKGEKRPRDLNQWAKRMTDIVSGEVEDREPMPEEQGKRPGGGRTRAEGPLIQERAAVPEVASPLQAYWAERQ
jgi:hypothetical protein